MTYRELNERANQLAHSIIAEYKKVSQQDLKPDTLIALYLDRSLEMIISILAVLKAGGAYVPIAPEYPKERTQFMLEDINAALIVTQEHHLQALENILKEITTPIKLIAADGNISNADLDITNLTPMSSAHDLAYVIYTSGTTGKPKGVMVEHVALINLVMHNVKYYNFSSDEIVLLLSDYVFDVSVGQIFLSLLRGAKLVLLAESKHKNAFEISAIIKSTNTTYVDAPSSLLSTLDIADVKSIKRIVSGGEKTSLNFIDKFKEKLINAYGPTEAVVETHQFKTLFNYNYINSLPIGKVITNKRSYILNENLQPTPIGTPGELYIGGAGLARGYLNQPKLTKERFIENPFATPEDIEKGYTRLYKTGDIVRWLPDGNIEYIGRNDAQIKIRGFRVELGEIENVLSKLPHIKQAVVIDREKAGNKYSSGVCYCQWCN